MNKGRPPHVQSLAEETRLGHWELSLPHRTDAHRLFWITRGQGRALLDGAQIGFGAHCAFFVPAGSLFRMESGPNTLAQILFYPSGSLLPSHPGLARVRDGQDQGILTQFFDSIRRESENSDYNWQVAMRLYGDLAAVWLSRQTMETGTEDLGRILTRRFVSAMPDPANAQSTVGGIAANLDVSAQHLSLVCKRHSGYSAAGLLNAQLAHAVAKTLLETSLPQNFISLQMGFGSVSYFSRFVRKNLGTTPSALRRAGRVI
ncbi:MAG: helix-turn-helix domain-containing protein [Paracoccaceae bacterium]